MPLTGRTVFIAIGLTCCCAQFAAAQTTSALLAAPVYHMTKKVDSKTSNPLELRSLNPHPLDTCLTMAYEGQSRISETIKDYTATLVRRERIGGELRNIEVSHIKIRNPGLDESGNPIPFSAYVRFMKPTSVDGREVIWVQGRDENKVIAHEAGSLLGRITVKLDPNGPIAMRDNRYPISEIGVLNLVNRLIERGEMDRRYDECEVICEEKELANRGCQMIQVTHPEPREHFGFHIARIYIDDEMRIPIRYASWSWPVDGGQPKLEEEYTYLNIKTNVGLTDLDFDPTNKEYNFK